MSLRSRLILTHLIVILLTFIIIAVSLLYILRGYQRQIQLARLGDAVVPLAFEARAMLQSNVSPREALARLEEQAGDVGRVMIITDKGLVLADAAYGLANRTVNLIRPNPQRDYVWGSYAVRTRVGDRNLVFVAIPAGQVNGQMVYIALSSLERRIGTALLDILPGLMLAGGVALLVSIAAALLLARSVARPVAQLTRATQAFAEGRYDERVPQSGSDEVGRLGHSFNAMAERVQQSRQMEKDFVANVSHELKTPLTSIQGFSQAILDGAVQDLEGARRAAQTIYDETTRMARLVGDLLALARFESGETPLSKESMDLVELVPRWLERLRPRAEALGEKLVAEVNPVPCISGDPGQLEQVFTNLVDNALKYGRPGGSVTVTTGTETSEMQTRGSRFNRKRAGEDRRREWVRISVADTGVGIPEDDLPRVFERFYRGDKARAAGGSGLGLSIAQEIISAHGGKITVQSDPERGSTFTVLIPT